MDHSGLAVRLEDDNSSLASSSASSTVGETEEIDELEQYPARQDVLVPTTTGASTSQPAASGSGMLSSFTNVSAHLDTGSQAPSVLTASKGGIRYPGNLTGSKRGVRAPSADLTNSKSGIRATNLTGSKQGVKAPDITGSNSGIRASNASVTVVRPLFQATQLVMLQ